jgi:hypothetical protein
MQLLKCGTASRTISGLRAVFPSLRVSYSPGMGQSVDVLLADKPKLLHF